MAEEKHLLRVDDLCVAYKARSPFGFQEERIVAVDGVSFSVAAGETVALVGESGSGKSSVAKALLRLLRPERGRIEFLGTDVAQVSEREFRPLRPQMQLVFQDPYSSLNPKLAVGIAVGEPLGLHRKLSGAPLRAAVAEAFREVGLPPDAAERYPHEFSGGQRQRVAIARALAPRPQLLVCDEPLSALDLSVQAQIANLLLQLQEQTKLAMLFISHDLRVVRRLAHRVLVLYLGHIAEEGPAEVVFSNPVHPYTRALLSAIPRREPGAAPPAPLAGEPPDPRRRPSGCSFHPRCPLAQPRCAQESPPLVDVGEGRKAACWVTAPPK